jgi:hypothetical protein
LLAMFETGMAENVLDKRETYHLIWLSRTSFTNPVLPS